TVILYEDPEIWRGHGGNGFYDDGRVVWVPRAEYASMFEDLERQRVEAESGEAPAAHGAPAAIIVAGGTQGDGLVRIVSRGVELAGAPMHSQLSPRAARRLPGFESAMPGPMQGTAEWRMTLFNQTDRQIDDVILSVTGAVSAQQVSAVPPGDVLLPGGLLEVVVPVWLSPGRQPPVLHLEAEVVGVRFNDGSTAGDAQALAKGYPNIELPDLGM